MLSVSLQSSQQGGKSPSPLQADMSLHFAGILATTDAQVRFLKHLPCTSRHGRPHLYGASARLRAERVHATHVLCTKSCTRPYTTSFGHCRAYVPGGIAAASKQFIFTLEREALQAAEASVLDPQSQNSVDEANGCKVKRPMASRHSRVQLTGVLARSVPQFFSNAAYKVAHEVSALHVARVSLQAGIVEKPWLPAMQLSSRLTRSNKLFAISFSQAGRSNTRVCASFVVFIFTAPACLHAHTGNCETIIYRLCTTLV